MLLSLYSGFQCQDSGDKIYGLLRLADPRYEIPEVDYGKSAEQVYEDTIRIIFTTNQPGTLSYLRGTIHSLSALMDLPEHSKNVLQGMLDHMRTHVIVEASDANDANDTVPILNALGFNVLGSAEEWWYEYRGERYHGLAEPWEEDRS